MSLFGKLFGGDKTQHSPALQAAIEHAVSAVEPLLKQTGGYPNRYLKPVSVALEYTNQLAVSVPGPVAIDRESYAKDAFVHALFPDIEAISAALFSSRALQEYLSTTPPGDELYALMGMRRVEKKIMGMELAGQNVQRDVLQQAIYFTSHTIENPSPSEAQSRDLIATHFFHSLVGKVKKRIEQRKQDKKSLMTEKEGLLTRLRTASRNERTALEAQLAALMSRLHATVSSLELDSYFEDFESVLLHPEEHLRMDQTPVVMDSMGIRRMADDTERGTTIVFNELIGYDRREWTVTLVRCTHLQNVSFADKLDQAYRRLTL